MTDASIDLGDGLQQLSGLLVSDVDLTTLLGRVADITQRCIAPATGAGVLLSEGNGSLRVAAATDDATARTQEALLAGHDAALRDALDCGEAVTGGPLPVTGVESLLAVPLKVGEATEGVLVLVSTKPAAFDDDARDCATACAAQAAYAVHNARTYDDCMRLVGQLTEALDARVVIEQAKGILMGQRQLTAEQAFEILREASQHRNVKLRDVAAELVADAPAG